MSVSILFVGASEELSRTTGSVAYQNEDARSCVEIAVWHTVSNLAINDKNYPLTVMTLLLKFCRYVGPLRAMHFALIGLLSITAVFSMGAMQKTGLMMFPTLIAPAIVPMIFFVLPLDMMMCRIMMSQRDETTQKRYRQMIRLNAVAFAVLLGAWLPFYSRLLSG